MLETIAGCIKSKEPALLIGETGVGKTSCVQYLSKVLHQKLVVVNLNRQSDSADLLGG
jgi:midasin